MMMMMTIVITIVMHLAFPKHYRQWIIEQHSCSQMPVSLSFLSQRSLFSKGLRMVDTGLMVNHVIKRNFGGDFRAMKFLLEVFGSLGSAALNLKNFLHSP